MYLFTHIYIYMTLVPESCPKSVPQTGDAIIKLSEDEESSHIP